MSNSIFSQHTRLSEEVFRRFMELPQGESFQAEYICKSRQDRSRNNYRLRPPLCHVGAAGLWTDPTPPRDPP